jgi:hypothetical protein
MIAKIGKKAAEETVNGAIFQIGLGKKINVFDFLSSVDARNGINLTRRERSAVQGATTTSTTSCGRSWRTASCTPTTSSSASSWRPWTGSSRYETDAPRNAAILGSHSEIRFRAEAVRSRRAPHLVQRAGAAGLHPVAARALGRRRVPERRERVRPPVQRRGQEPAGGAERQAARRAHVPLRLLLHRHGAHRPPPEIR